MSDQFRYTLTLTTPSGTPTSEHVFSNREELRRELVWTCHLDRGYVERMLEIAHANLGTECDLVLTQERNGAERLVWSARLCAERVQ